MRVYGPVTCDETARKGEENSRFYLDKIPAKEKNRLGETRNESKSYINIVFKNNTGILKVLTEIIFSMQIDIDEILSKKL